MWILKQTRFLHKWIGLFLAIVVSVTALSGFLMNHKHWLEGGRSESRSERWAGRLAYFDDDNAKQMMARIAAECGNKNIKEVKIKHEHGEYVWEIKLHRGGKIKIRNGVGRAESKEKEEKEDEGLKDFVEDLHTWKFAGPLGRYVLDAGAIAIIVLSFSGVYLSLRATYKKWRRSRAGPDGPGIEPPKN